jgi:cytoskeletal protein RodZ
MQEKVQEMVKEGEAGDGALFQKIRILLGVSRDEIQDHTKISMAYIEGIDENRFELLPQPVYVKGFLRNYLKYIGIINIEDHVTIFIERLQNWIDRKSNALSSKHQHLK